MKWVWWICVMLLVTGPMQPARSLAQTATPTTEPTRPDLAGRTVEDVRVLGNATVATPVILNLVRSHVGDKFDPQTVQEDYQRIYDLKKFSNVEAKVEPTATGVVIAFVVTEQKQLRNIAYRGNLRVDTLSIQDVVDAHVGEAIDPFRIAISKRAIVTLYKSQNYPFAHVDIDNDALNKRGELIFNIVEGPNVRVRNIRFIGAKSFTEARLRGQIPTKTWIFIFRHGTFDPDEVEDSVAAAHQYYTQKGFFDARVGRKLIWSADMSEVQIDFLVDEGVRYKVDRVSFNGASTVSEADLRKNLKLVEGVYYDNDLLQRDIRQIVKAYSPFGFIFQPQSQDPDYLRIDTKPVFKTEPGHCELVYEISEGKPFRLGRIIPKGNSKTQDKVILREMRLTPGRLYDSAAVADAIDRLRGTPYFGHVDATPFGSDPTSRDLLVEVQEAKTATFNIGAGINSNGGVGGNITYDQKNFDIGNWPSNWEDIFTDRAFVGAGQEFRASIEPGTKATNASILFSEPYLFDQPYSFTSEAYLRDRIRENYDDDRLGGRLTFGKRFTPVYSAGITLRGEDVNITNINDKEDRAFEILDYEGHTTLTSVGLRLTRDTTNRGLLPSHGMADTAYLEVYGALGGQINSQKLSLSHDQYFTLHEDLLDRRVILALHADAGYFFSTPPFFERFYGGGIGSVRGFAFRGISPRSGPDDDPVGGDFLTTGSAEVSYPIAGESLRGVVFTDVGTVNRSIEVGTIRSSIGTGIRLTLPFLGQTPVALDFAIPITKDSKDTTQLVSFSLGFVP